MSRVNMLSEQSKASPFSFNDTPETVGKVKQKACSSFLNQKPARLRHQNKAEVTKNKKVEYSSDNNESSTDETPILYLDVNFGNGDITRIVMYENDKPEEVAEAFCHENGLDFMKQQKLVQIIYQQLESFLEKIEEESEENYQMTQL